MGTTHIPRPLPDHLAATAKKVKNSYKIKSGNKVTKDRFWRSLCGSKNLASSPGYVQLSVTFSTEKWVWPGDEASKKPLF